MASAPGAIVRPRATVIPMARRELTIPVLDQTGTTEGEFHWFGGLQVYWQAEASEKSQSEPSFRQIRLVANDLVGYTRASEALLEDNAASLESFLTGPMGFGGAMVAAEDYAFFNGNGVGQPLGILNATGVTTSVARAVQASVTYEDLLDMEAAFYSPNNNGMWVISQSQMANIMKMTGPTGNPNYVYRPSAADGSPATLLGRPVRFTLDMLPRGTTTSAGDVMLADFGFYLVGDRKRITVDSTRQERWRFNQVSWKVVARVDGQPWLSAPITSRDGVTTVSPFVLLGAKAT
jgi:HK97 family phage major capsid protein